MDHIQTYGETPQTYIYEHPAPEEDGVTEAQALIVMRRSLGFLAAIPVGVLTEEEAQAGRQAPMEAAVGPSTTIEVAASLFTEEGLLPQPGITVPCVLVDFAATAASRFTVLGAGGDPEILLPFDVGSPDLMPEPSALLQQALVWAQRRDTPQERIAFYSAEEGPTPTTRPRLRLSKSDPPRAGAGGTGTEQPAAAKAKKVTTASLATQLETLASALPGLTSRLEEISSKQTAMEARIAAGPTAPLAEPLGSLGAQPKSWAATLAGPPPTHHRQLLAPQATLPAAAVEAAELEGEMSESSGEPLARAVLAQSQALTALVAQLSSSQGDPLLDNPLQSAVSTRGAAQRAKMQDELATGRGVFYAQVLANMARRMSPAAQASTDPAILLGQGVCLSRYWERFGGFGQNKDLALIAFQVGMIMDAFQAGRTELAQDHTSLLAVSLEQAALDGGRLDIGYHMTWLEEPPSGMYTNRPAAGLFRSRPFAPLASQRWVTIVLGYIKEMELIQSRRADAGKPRLSPAGSDQPPGDAPSPKKPPRRPRKENQQ
eukprot:s1976_g10.t1